MKIGERTSTHLLLQSQRTIEKVRENAALFMVQIKNSCPELAKKQEDWLLFSITGCLSWTANDVLSQAVDDGYVSTEDGFPLA
jgi:hypothetical protein